MKRWLLCALLMAGSLLADEASSDPEKEISYSFEEGPGYKPPSNQPCKPAPSKPIPCKPKPEPCKPKPVPCPPICSAPFGAEGYNQRAGVKLCGICWQGFCTIDFIYWQAKASGLAAAIRNPSGPLLINPNASLVELPSCYRPGLKVGLGFTFDQGSWETKAEYTRWRSKNAVFAGQPSPPKGALLGVWFFDDSSSVQSKWHCYLDRIDWVIARPLYTGKRLIFEPMFGIRASWLHQYLHIVGPIFEGTLLEISKFTGFSWGIGPRAGLGSNWLLGWGFRAIANASGSILWTNTQSTAVGSGVPGYPKAGYHLKSSRDTLRSNANLGLGLGWGRYLGGQQWHIDLSAVYDFEILWGQMSGIFADFADGVLTSSIASFPINAVNDLYFHGLTLNARLNF